MPDKSATTSTTVDTNQTSVEVWKELFTKNVASAKKTLKLIESGVLPCLDSENIPELISCLQDVKSLWSRIIFLLQNTSTRHPNVEAAVLKLTEKLLKLEWLPSNEAKATSEFNVEDEISVWLRGIPKRPIPKANLELLHIGLLLGIKEASLREDRISEILRNALFRKPTKKGEQRDPVAYFPIEFLSINPLNPKQIEPLLLTETSLRNKINDATERLKYSEQCYEIGQEQIFKLLQEVKLNNETLLHANEQLAGNEEIIKMLRKQIVDMKNGYEHRITEIKARARGRILTPTRKYAGQGLRAISRDSPFIEVAKQEFESILELVDKEEAWLQSSD